MRKHGKSIAVAIGAFALVAVILWLDISTGVWSEVVILSGLAAGLVTFILTVMVLDRVVARSTARGTDRVPVGEGLAMAQPYADPERIDRRRPQVRFWRLGLPDS